MVQTNWYETKKKSPIFIAVTQQGEKKTEVKITYITKYNKID